MKEFIARLIDSIEPGHYVVTITSLIAAALSTRQDEGLRPYHRFTNTIAGFVSACLAGFVLLEMGWAPWASSGTAYLVGHIGNRLTNALIIAAKMAEADPLAFAGRVINLVWSWKLPTKNTDKNGSE